MQTRNCLLTILSSIFYILALPPFNFYFFMELSLGLLLFIWRTCSAKQAFYLGWLYGTLSIGVATHWLYYSLHDYGQLNSGITLILLLIIASVLALTHGLHGGLMIKLFPHPSLSRELLVFPLLLTMLSYFPKLPPIFIALSHLNSPLRKVVPFLGEPGLTFIIAQLSALLLRFITAKQTRTRLYAGLVFLLLWLTVYLIPSLSLRPSDTLKIATLQANLTPIEKWDYHQQPKYLNEYLQKSIPLLGVVDLIVWPEGSIPFSTEQSERFVELLNTYTQKSPTTLILGLTRLYEEKSYNSLALIKQNKHFYDKRHLMPLGEFIPFWLARWCELLKIPANSFTAGSLNQPLLAVKGHPFSANICYETLFPSLTWNTLPQAEFIVTISDDSWFRRSWVLEQHLASAQMLSLSSGRAQIFVNNAGISALIDASGYLTKTTQANDLMIGTIPCYTHLTFWVKFRLFLQALPYILLLITLFKTHRRNSCIDLRK